jgi:hypothetical protein
VTVSRGSFRSQKFRGSQLAWLILIWGILAALAGFVLWRDALDPRGMVIEGITFWLSYKNRLGPLSLLVLCVLVFAMILQANGLRQRVAGLPAVLATHWREAGWIFAGAGLVGALASVWVLRAFPYSGDEYGYLFQAKTFLAGRLWNPMPPLPDFFHLVLISFLDGKWVSTYPPGWPLLLAAASAMRLPFWLACPAAGALLLFALFKLGQRRDGPLGGVLAVMLFALSPFFAFNAGSYFNHVPATAAGLFFCWAALDFLDQPRLSKACLTGIALGVLGLIRPVDVLLFALPFAAEFCWRARRQHYLKAPAIVLVGLPFLAALLLYNHTITGSSFLGFSTDWTDWTGRAGFGFHLVDEHGDVLTLRDQLRIAAFRTVLAAEWTSPILVLGYGAAAVWLTVRRRLSFLDLIFPTYVIGYLFVPFTGTSQYGPRYYFEAWPLVVLTVVSGLVPLLQVTRQRWRAFGSSLLMAHLAIALAAGVIFGIFMRKIINEGMDLYDQAAAQGLSNAVIVVHSGTSPSRFYNPRGLVRNGIALDGEVIYALDFTDRLGELRQLFPQRRFYIYERESDYPKGMLRRLW